MFVYVCVTVVRLLLVFSLCTGELWSSYCSHIVLVFLCGFLVFLDIVNSSLLSHSLYLVYVANFIPATKSIIENFILHVFATLFSL